MTYHVHPFTYHTDPGHGWLEVTSSDLAQLGIVPSAFSRYSYADRSGVTPRYFLEEDCDAGIFIAAFTAKHGEVPQIVERYAHNTFVRNLPRIY